MGSMETLVDWEICLSLILSSGNGRGTLSLETGVSRTGERLPAGSEADGAISQADSQEP